MLTEEGKAKWVSEPTANFFCRLHSISARLNGRRAVDCDWVRFLRHRSEIARVVKTGRCGDCDAIQRALTIRNQCYAQCIPGRNRLRKLSSEQCCVQFTASDHTRQNCLVSSRRRRELNFRRLATVVDRKLSSFHRQIRPDATKVSSRRVGRCEFGITGTGWRTLPWHLLYLCSQGWRATH